MIFYAYPSTLSMSYGLHAPWSKVALVEITKIQMLLVIYNY